MNRSRPAVVVFWTSIGVIVATLLVLGTFQWRANEDVVVESVGSRPAATASPTPTPSATESSSSPSPTPTATAGPQMVAAPVRVTIPALDVNTKIFPVGLDKNQAIEIPEDIRYVGLVRPRRSARCRSRFGGAGRAS